MVFIGVAPHELDGQTQSITDGPTEAGPEDPYFDPISFHVSATITTGSILVDNTIIS